MKKSIILFAIVSIIVFSCNPLKPDSGSAVLSSFNAADSITSAIARNMVAHYLDTPMVDHGLDSIIKQVSLNNSDLFKIFKLNNITRIRLLTAAYLNTDPVVARRNQTTVLVQLKEGYNSRYYYYDIESFGPGRLCPPPYGCMPE